MSTKFQAAIFLLGIVSLSGVALARQIRGQDGRTAVPAAISTGAEQGRLRVPGPVRLRYAEIGCGAGICIEPPKGAEQAEAAPAVDACSSLGTARDRNGRAIRRLCSFN